MFRDRGDTTGYSRWQLGINMICTTVPVGRVRKVVSLNIGRDIGEVLIKKVGNIIIIMIVGLPFRW